MLCFTIACKVSFIISAGFLSLLVLFYSIKQKYFLKYFFSGVIATVTVLLPISLLKFNFYGDFSSMFKILKKINDPAISEFLFTLSKDSVTFIQIDPYYFIILPMIATIPISTKILTTIVGFGFNTLYCFHYSTKKSKII